MFSWLRKKAAELVPTPLPPMPIIPGERYVLDTDNPFQPAPRVVVLEVVGNWVKYRFTNVSNGCDNHTTLRYFRNAYKRSDDIPQPGVKNV